MTTFMDTMRGLLNGQPTPVDEEDILPGVQIMMRQMGNHGWLTHTGIFLPTVVQELVERGFAEDDFVAQTATHTVKLTARGRAYIARIGGQNVRPAPPPTGTITAILYKPPHPPIKPDESA